MCLESPRTLEALPRDDIWSSECPGHQLLAALQKTVHIAGYLWVAIMQVINLLIGDYAQAFVLAGFIGNQFHLVFGLQGVIFNYNTPLAICFK